MTLKMMSQRTPPENPIHDPCSSSVPDPIPCRLQIMSITTMTIRITTTPWS